MLRTPYECENGVALVVVDGRLSGDGVEILVGDPDSKPGGLLVVGLESLQAALEKAGISPLWIPPGHHRRVGRKRPYTEDEIGKKPCFRCGKPSTFQWSICADGNIQRPLCASCDVELNDHVMAWAGDPDAASKQDAYVSSVLTRQRSGETPMDERREETSP